MLNKPRVTSLQFLNRLVWLDGEPLLDYVQPYRRKLFTQALDTFDRHGRPKYSMVLCGRAKKNWKSTDLILAALFVLMIRRSPQDSDGLILANDSDQAADDLKLAKRLVQINPCLAAEIEVYANELRLRDGTATLKILPAKDVAGAHGKSAAIVCFDEIHGYKDWSLLEALSPDPTRDCLTWITSYASLYNKAGAPLYDLMRIGKSGKDKRMLFSCTQATTPLMRGSPSCRPRSAPIHRCRRGRMVPVIWKRSERGCLLVASAVCI